ncbi:acyltransferase [Brachybacterium phenoliresistens]|uniref:Acyltransferase n=1 Tax=Brachybacterium phenoliresistens TaxID=396014 RepID=Z9JQU6_9MICO|nr:acyltransferase [Brachybacterium phenoliresistens]EWS80775.1 acyltransferase [Brachybacterium phenoliresistens]
MQRSAEPPSPAAAVPLDQSRARRASTTAADIPGAGTRRLDSLTGLRWWAAFGVFAYHYRNVGDFPGLGLAGVGYTGVMFFFVLSGFVLTWSARPGVTIPQFWSRRVARIWPAHLVALLVAIPVFYAVLGPSAGSWQKEFTWLPIVLSVVLLQGFFRDTAISMGGNPAAWTLSCEALFYFLHPFVNRAFSAMRGPALAVVAVIVVVLGVLSAWPGNTLPAAFVFLWQFFIGMLVALVMRRGLRISVPWAVPIAIGAVVILGFWFLIHGPLAGTATQPVQFMVRFALPIIYGLMIAMFASIDLAGRASPMRWRPMVIGGDISYAFYLVHATVLYAFREVGGRNDSPMLALILLLASIGAACILHYGVERPLERVLRRWGDRRFGRPDLRASEPDRTGAR